MRVTAKAADIDQLDLALEERLGPPAGAGEALVEVAAAGVNPTDVKAVLGAMPHAVWPRTPGRDYAGIVVEGPAELRRQGGLGLRRRARHPPRRHATRATWCSMPAHLRERSRRRSRLREAVPSACRSSPPTRACARPAA